MNDASPLSLGTAKATTGMHFLSAALSLASRLACSGQRLVVGVALGSEKKSNAVMGRDLDCPFFAPPSTRILGLQLNYSAPTRCLFLFSNPTDFPFGPFLPASAVVAGWLARGLASSAPSDAGINEAPAQKEDKRGPVSSVLSPPTWTKCAGMEFGTGFVSGPVVPSPYGVIDFLAVRSPKFFF